MILALSSNDGTEQFACCTTESKRCREKPDHGVHHDQIGRAKHYGVFAQRNP